MLWDLLGTLQPQQGPSMAAKSSTQTQYLELHGKTWRVTVAVPPRLRPVLGHRLKQSLETDSLTTANVLKKRVVAEFKARIARAWEAHGGKTRSRMSEAVAMRRELEAATDPEDFDDVNRAILERIEELRQAGTVGYEYVDFGDGEPPQQEPVLSREAKAEIAAFKAIAVVGAIPITLHHQEFTDKLKTKDRSKFDEPRAMAIFLKWLLEKEIEPYISNITKGVAVRFMDEMPEFTGLSWGTNAKYFGRLKFYWSWLVKREYAKANPFDGLTLDKPSIVHGEEERSFTDVEIQRLLMGKPDPGMMDVLLIGALTGARLDAIIDMRVGDTVEGWFTFKPQKKEKSARDVPIHPALVEIVKRRVEGLRPEDDFFPDWPAPQAEGSKRERSAYFSKRFTKYRRDLGVDDVIEGKRRSLVNFHSFRRWFITKLERAGTSEPMIAAIVGHKRSGLTLGRYSEGPEMVAAKKAIAKVQLPPLDGSPVTEAQPLTPRRRR